MSSKHHKKFCVYFCTYINIRRLGYFYHIIPYNDMNPPVQTYFLLTSSSTFCVILIFSKEEKIKKNPLTRKKNHFSIKFSKKDKSENNLSIEQFSTFHM